MNITLQDLSDDIRRTVASALEEDIGNGDITAELIPESQTSHGHIITREACTFCGRPWFDETFRQLGGLDEVNWHVEDGDQLQANQTLVSFTGNSRILLTGERTALNFIQLLSGVATVAHQFAALLEGSETKILDTRKTIPGLRLAQKYAVTIGGCHNHRIGLYDAFLIKENHIAACGGIAAAVKQAKSNQPDKPVEVEVESLAEFEEALKSGADIVMLDELAPNDIREAVALRDASHPSVKIEISGSIDATSIQRMAKFGVDYISSGSLTKHVRAIDLSMRLEK